MSIKAKEHGRRWITAISGAALIFFLYAKLGHLAVQICAVVISFAAYFEFLRIMMHSANTPGFRTMKICIGLVAATLFQLPVERSYILAYGLLMLFTLCIYRFWETDPEQVRDHHFHLDDLFASAFGLLYIVGFLAYLPQIHGLPDGPIWLVALVLMIWASDIAAYYGGHTFGRHKLALVISPGKTMEGSVSGILGSLIVALVVKFYFLPEISLPKLLVLGFLTSLISQLGDLFESLLKRVVGVKDSGYLLPGHGGMLDRFDSLILAAPFYYFLLRLWIV